MSGPEGLDISYLPGRPWAICSTTPISCCRRPAPRPSRPSASARPAITFQTDGDRPSRFRQESQLFGEARLTVEPDPQAIAGAIMKLVGNPAERLRRAAIGRERIGPPGAIQAIIAELTK